MRNQKYLTLLKRFELSENKTVMGKPKYSEETILLYVKGLNCLKMKFYV